MTKLMMVITVFFGLSWCAISNKHLKVDILMVRFSPKVQIIVDTITMITVLLMLAVITWQSFLEAGSVVAVTSLLQLPLSPFYGLMAVGFAISGLPVKMGMVAAELPVPPLVIFFGIILFYIVLGMFLDIISAIILTIPIIYLSMPRAPPPAVQWAL